MIYAFLDSIRCHEETDEVGADEPYVIVTAIDLRSSVSVSGLTIPIPASRAFRYGPFRDVDARETHRPSFLSFWGLNGEERALSNPDDAIFLVALMENDDGNAEALRGLVAASVNSALFASLGVSDRSTRVGLLMEAINSAIRTPTGGPTSTIGSATHRSSGSLRPTSLWRRPGKPRSAPCALEGTVATTL